MTPAEWAALDEPDKTELLLVVGNGAGWDHESYDSYELAIGPAMREYVVQTEKRVRFVALSQPLGR